MTKIRNRSFILLLFLFLLSFLISGISFSFTPNPNPTRPERPRTNSGFFTLAFAVFFRPQDRFRKLRNRGPLPGSAKQRVHEAADRQVGSDDSDKPLSVFVPRGTFRDRVLDVVLGHKTEPTLCRLLSAAMCWFCAKYEPNTPVRT